MLNRKSDGLGMVYYHMITELDDSEDLVFRNKGAYRGDEMEFTLDCIAEVVEVFSRCKKFVKIQSLNN